MTLPRALVTGANGPLGANVASCLFNSGAVVTGLSRQASPAGFPGDWCTCDLLDSEAVNAALTEKDVVVHCASNVHNPQDDADALDNLLRASRSVRNLRIVYVSIAGIDEAAKVSPYYAMKLRNEETLRHSEVAHTIVRIAQFHPFIAMVLSNAVFGPLVLTPSVVLQPVDLDFAAQQLAATSLHSSDGFMSNIHGPEALTLSRMAASWLKIRRLRKIRTWFPATGLMKGFAAIKPVAGEGGGPTWEQWLTATPAERNPYGETLIT